MLVLSIVVQLGDVLIVGDSEFIGFSTSLYRPGLTLRVSMMGGFFQLFY